MVKWIITARVCTHNPEELICRIENITRYIMDRRILQIRSREEILLISGEERIILVKSWTREPISGKECLTIYVNGHLNRKKFRALQNAIRVLCTTLSSTN